MIDKEFVVVGSPATVREKLADMAKRLNVGHLMVALQFGSMPHALAKKNIELFGREVLPHLQKIWEESSGKTIGGRRNCENGRFAIVKWPLPDDLHELPAGSRYRREPMPAKRVGCKTWLRPISEPSRSGIATSKPR